MLLAALEKFADILSPFRPVYAFSIAGGLLGGGPLRTSLVVQYGGMRQRVYPPLFIALYLVMFVLTCGLVFVIHRAMEAGLV